MSPILLMLVAFLLGKKSGGAPSWPGTSSPPPMKPMLITKHGVTPLHHESHPNALHPEPHPADASQHAAPDALTTLQHRWEALYARRNTLPSTFARDYVQAHAFIQKAHDAHPSVNVSSGLQKWSAVASQYERVHKTPTAAKVPRIP